MTKSAKCPLCKKPTAQKYRPFCSKRCADVDLGRWLKGGYAFPANNEETPDLGVEPRPAPRRDGRE